MIFTSPTKPIIIPIINLLNTDHSFGGHSKHSYQVRRSILPFLGNALSWLTGTATTKDVNSIKKSVNQLIEAWSTQQESLLHIISILNVTRYAAQVSRHSINVLMDKVDETFQDVNNLYNLTASLATSLSYHQLILHIKSVLANLWDSLSYIRTVSMHTMDYLHQCSYDQYTFTSNLTYYGSYEDVSAHRGNITTHITSTSII